MNFFWHGKKRQQDLSELDDSLRLIPESDEQPEHLLTWGKIQKTMPSGKICDVGEIEIAITQSGDLSEFSSPVGSAPNNSLTRAVLGNVNQLINGKVIQDGSDLLHVTEKPTDWLDKERFRQECKNHAVTKITLEPIFERLPDLSVPENLKEVDKLAEDLVEGGLRLPRPPVNFLPQAPNENNG